MTYTAALAQLGRVRAAGMFSRTYFILAPNFHGATLLARLLHAHPAVVCLGDTYPSNLFDQICGCGSLVSQCEFWRAIKRETDAARYQDKPSMLPLEPDVFGPKYNERMFQHMPAFLLKRLVPEQAARLFVSDYDRFVRAVYARFAQRRPDVFVDGVKSPSRVKALACAGERIDGILHVVRDPADFVRSTLGGPGFGKTMRAARAWRLAHDRIASVRGLAPFLRVDYDRLCGDTDETMRRIFEFVGVEPKTTAELRNQPRDLWHFMGHSSLFKFDWHIKAKKYPVTRMEKLLIDAIAQPGHV